MRDPIRDTLEHAQGLMNGDKVDVHIGATLARIMNQIQIQNKRCGKGKSATAINAKTPCFSHADAAAKAMEEKEKDE